MKVKIYKPTRTAMQSGVARTKKWVLEPIEIKNSRRLDTLMGWVSTNDVRLSELEFSFANKEAAIEFAKNNKFEYEVVEPKKAVVKKKSYAENFL